MRSAGFTSSPSLQCKWFPWQTKHFRIIISVTIINSKVMTYAAVSQNCYKRTPQIKHWQSCLPISLVRDKLLIKDVRPRKVRKHTFVTRVMLSGTLRRQLILKSCSPGPGIHWGYLGISKSHFFGILAVFRQCFNCIFLQQITGPSFI